MIWGQQAKMEYWELKVENILIFIFALRLLIKTDFIPPNPLFQYTSIPTPQGIWLRSAYLGTDILSHCFCC